MASSKHKGAVVKALRVTAWIQGPFFHPQDTAQRNAHQAMIELGKRRREREDVERFLARMVSQRQPGEHGAVPSSQLPRPARNASDTGQG
jgi:hypothetical protein